MALNGDPQIGADIKSKPRFRDGPLASVGCCFHFGRPTCASAGAMMGLPLGTTMNTSTRAFALGLADPFVV
jgi:hypothetical protein